MSSSSSLIPSPVIKTGNFLFQTIPDWSLRLKNNDFRGDFLAMISREGYDKDLAEKVATHWNRKVLSERYKLDSLSVPSLPASMPSLSVLSGHANFLRSDHVMFWYHNNTHYGETLKAILLTDTGLSS